MNDFKFLSDKFWRIAVLRRAFGKSFFTFLGFAVATGVACYFVRGPEATLQAIEEEFELLGSMLPRVFVALSIASIIWAMLPRDQIAGLVGKDSGMRGLLIALGAGTFTPGGPSSAFPLLAVLAGAGADRGALVCYITAWATLGVQRIIIWDMPLMGADFATLRFLAGLAIPIVAGLIARWLAWPINIPEPDEAPSR